MSSSLTWKIRSNLGQSLDKGIVSSLSAMKGVVDQANQIVKTIEQFINLASIFLTGEVDIIGLALKEGVNAINTVILDTMTTGGSLIVLTPFNRMNPRVETINLVDNNSFIVNKDNSISYNKENKSTIYPITLPAMSIREALQEFAASFNNRNDPFRPTWKNKAVGFGLIISAPNAQDLSAALRSLESLFKFDDFDKATTKYAQALNNIKIDKQKQENTDDWSLLDTESIWAEAHSVFPYAVGKDSKGTAVLQDKVSPVNKTLPSLHWYGLSLSNVPFLSKLLQTIDELVSTLQQAVQPTKTAITELAKALINRLEIIKNVLDTMYTVVQTLLVSFSNTGLYVFRVDSETGVAGIVSAINAGINKNDPAIQPLVRALDYPFSAMAFIGAGSGINLDSWKKLFSNLFGMLEDQYDIFNDQLIANSLNQLSSADFNIIPDFKNNKVFSFGTSFTIRIASTKVLPGAPYYYIYNIKDEMGNIVSSYDKRASLVGNNIPHSQMAKVNQTSFPVTIPVRSAHVGKATYRIEITVFDMTLIHNDIAFSYPFTLTDMAEVPTGLLTTGTTDINLPAGGKIVGDDGVTTSIPLTGGSVPIKNKKITISNTKDRLDLHLFSVESKIIETFSSPPVPPIPNPINAEYVPVTLCFDFDSVLSYKIRRDSEYTQVTLPACITLTEAGTYDYSFFLPDSGWTILDSFVLRTDGANPVC